MIEGINEEVCKRFRNDPTVNPLTGRRINHMGPTYMRFHDACLTFDKTKFTRDKNVKNSVLEKSLDNNKTLIFVEGLGCTRMTIDNVEMYKDYLKFYTKLPKSNIHFECNQSMSDTIVGIAKTYCMIKPTLQNPFVQQVYARVVEHMSKGEKVFLLGHSYGGAVVSVIVEALNSRPTIGKLHAATFGSIYVAPSSNTSNIDIVHYMKLGDVALKCNRLIPPKFTTESYLDKATNIVWLYSDIMLNKFKLFGSKENWDNHRSYTVQISSYLLDRFAK